VLVLHGICKLVVPFLYSHKNNGDTIAFCGDTEGKNIFPRIMKLDEDDFGEAHNRIHPEIKAIMNVTDGKKVLPLPDDNTMVQVSKVIPLPTTKEKRNQQWHPSKRSLTNSFRKHQTPSRNTCSISSISCWRRQGLKKARKTAIT